MFRLSYSEDFLVPIILAIFFGIIIATQIYTAAHRGTRYAITLVAVGLSFYCYTVLMVPPIEEAFTNAVGIASISPFLKDLFLLAGLISCMVLWKSLRIPQIVYWVAASLLAIYLVVAIAAWIQNRQRCTMATTPEFQACAQTELGGALAQLYLYAVVVILLICTLVFLRPLGETRSPGRIAGGLLLVSLTLILIWTLLCMAGVFDVYFRGELGPLQYFFRTPIAAAAALAWMLSAMYLPVARMWSAITFRVRASTVLKELDVSRDTPVIAGGRARYGVVDAMDALGRRIHEDGLRVIPCCPTEGADTVADYLLGLGVPIEVPVPVTADHQQQRAWLMQVSKNMDAPKSHREKSHAI